MLELGMIHPSQSEWCNAVVLVQKKDGSLHFCIDFQFPNTHMKEDSYPLPRIQEALESLVGTGHFSCLDLKSGFWQIKMDELSKQYSTFTLGNLGFYKCDHMPFGLCNMPATFQRLMQKCLGELNLTYCLIYLDDIIIFLQMAEEHLACLCIIFDQFIEHNINLKPPKCDFCRYKITYLGLQVFKDRVYPSNLNLDAIAECTPTQTYMEVHAFLSLWATTEGSSKGLHALHNHSVNISLEKGPAGGQSKCHLWKKPWKLLKHWSRHVWQLLFWCLLTTPNCSCWRLICLKRD